MNLDPLQLRALSAAVDEGTFEAAARRLHVTPSAVSQRLRALETATGRVLLVRSKPVRVTPSGRTVLRLARQLELLAADTAATLGAEDGTGEAVALSVAINADSLATWFLPAVAPLADAITFRLVRVDEHRTSELLREGEVVAAVTTDATPVAGCHVVALGAMRYRAAASPAFAARWFPDGTTPAAVARAPMVVFDRDDPLQHAYVARHAAPGADPPVHMVPSSAEFARAIAMGMGWGLLPELLLAGDAPEVVLLDADRYTDVPLHWQQWRLRTPALDLLADAVVAAARGALQRAPATGR